MKFEFTPPTLTVFTELKYLLPVLPSTRPDLQGCTEQGDKYQEYKINSPIKCFKRLLIGVNAVTHEGLCSVIGPSVRLLFIFVVSY